MKDKATPLTICLIDDDSIYQFTAKKFIELLDPMQKVLSFANGLQAINFFHQTSLQRDQLPDVIFLDINMPVMDGWEFLEVYNEVHHRLEKQIPIYMVSSSMDEKDILKSKQFNIVKDYIMKPMSQQRLSSILASHFGIS